MRLQFRAIGKPAPQGSKRFLGNGKMTESSPDLWPWRSTVTMAASKAMAEAGVIEPFTGPVLALVTFKFRRPKSHYGTGGNATRLRDNAPQFPITPPDIDKLERSTYDALTDARLWLDDAQIVSSYTDKEYANFEEQTGALILVQELR